MRMDESLSFQSIAGLRMCFFFVKSFLVNIFYQALMKVQNGVLGFRNREGAKARVHSTSLLELMKSL